MPPLAPALSSERSTLLHTASERLANLSATIVSQPTPTLNLTALRISIADIGRLLTTTAPAGTNSTADLPFNEQGPIVTANVHGGNLTIAIVSSATSAAPFILSNGIDVSIRLNASAAAPRAVLLYTGDVAAAIANAEATDSSVPRDAELISALVEVLPLDDSAGGEQPTHAADASLADAVSIGFALLTPMPTGGGECDEATLFGSVPAHRSCVSGCCSQPPASSERTLVGNATNEDTSPGPDGRVCMCSPRFGVEARGALCNWTVHCGAVGAADGRLESACTTKHVDGDVQVCECRAVGAIGVFAHQILPQLTLGGLFGSEGSSDGGAHSASSAHITIVMLAFCAATAGALVVTFWAYVRDREHMWQARPPPWLRPPAGGTWTFSTLWWHNWKLYHKVARIVYVVPGHVAHTRAQNVQLLILQLQLLAVGVCYLLGCAHAPHHHPTHRTAPAHTAAVHCSRALTRRLSATPGSHRAAPSSVHVHRRCSRLSLCRYGPLQSSSSCASPSAAACCVARCVTSS